MKKLSLLILSIISTFFLAGQTPGTLDFSFGNNGITLTNYNNNGDINSSYASALQADGKIVLGGHSVMGGVGNMTFVRYNPDGTLNYDFNAGGIKVLPFGGSDDRVEALVIQPDGKIIAVGYTTYTNGTNTQMTVTRLNTDGSLDNSFNANGMTLINFGNTVNAYGKSVALQDDGKIIVGGYIEFTDQNPEVNGAICRLTSSGFLDNTFGVNGIITHDILSQWNYMTQVAIQDEKIILGGISIRSADNVRFVTLCRYNADGSLDTGFGTSGITSVENSVALSVNASRSGMCISEDGKIILADYVVVGWYDSDLAVWRFHPDGSPDNYFGNAGMITTAMEGPSGATAVAVQADGKIVVGGWHYTPVPLSYDFVLVRYLENSYLDINFGTEGTGVVITNASSSSGLFDIIYSLLIQADGKILASGVAETDNTSYDFAVARYFSGLNIGVENPEQDAWELAIFPNPFTEETKLVFKLDEESIIKVEVFNAFGTKVTELTHRSYIKGEHQLSWDGSGLPAGMYVVKMAAGDMIYTTKLVKSF